VAGFLLGVAGYSISRFEISAYASSSGTLGLISSASSLFIGVFAFSVLWRLFAQRRRFKAHALSDARELEEIAQKGQRSASKRTSSKDWLERTSPPRVESALYAALEWRRRLAATDMVDLTDRFHRIVLSLEADQ
jgi:hypothetical protein